MSDTFFKQIEAITLGMDLDCSKEVAEFKERGLKFILKHNELLAEIGPLDDANESKYPDLALIDLLRCLVDILELKNEAQAIEIQALKFEIAQYEKANKLSNSISICTENMTILQDKLLEYQEKKVSSYQTGPKVKSAESKARWARAQQYFVDEIDKHKNLDDARIASVLKAGMPKGSEKNRRRNLPDPRK